MNSRHRERERPDVESPGGKKTCLRGEPLYQQRGQDFGLNPGTCRAVVYLRHVPQFEKRLKPFKHQFDLPPHTIEIQDVYGGQFLFCQRGKYNDILGRLQRCGLNDLSFATCLMDYPLLCCLGSSLTLAYGTQAGRESSASGLEEHFPIVGCLPFEATKVWKYLECLSR